jgi:hypothetical protein
MLIKNPIFILISFIFIVHSQPINSQPQEEKSLKEIIFWGPSPNELDSLNEEETEVYADYYLYIGQAAPELKKLGIELKDTTCFALSIKYNNDSTAVFERENGSIAYIFNDGKQKPKIIRGVMVDEEIISTAKDFFEIKN